jgi:hypothetical protein
MTDFVITSEPRVYGPGSTRSYFQDVALASVREPGSDEAGERLARYGKELEVAITAPTSAAERAEGRRALAIQGEYRREYRRGGDQAETRAASSTTIAGFTTPEYLIADWAAYRSPIPAFRDQTTKLPLPEFGLQVNVPSFAGASTFSTQTEDDGVSETEPTGSNIQTSIVTQAGQVTLSQQLYDRGGLPGLAFDKILVAQMMSQLEASVDSYVLTQALANSASVTDSSAFSFADFLQDVASAREKLSDSVGTRLLATHIFSTSDLFGYVTRQVDSENRPILTPDSGAIVQALAMNDPKWNSWTGVHLGQCRWHADDNIAATSGNTQIIVARPSEVFTFDGDEMSFAYPEPNAQELSVIVGLRAYVGVIVRFPKAIAAISGAAYPTSLV